jgi:Sulfotransferase family
MTCFFIGGAPRSGGTLLASILCSDRTTNPTLREAHYLREMVQAYRQGKQLFNTLEGGHYFTDFEDLRQFSSSWVQALLDKLAARYAPATHLVIKSFLMSVMFPAVFELLPEARFLVSVRDPRDIACSQIEVGEKQHQQGQNVRFPRDVTRLSRENRHYYLPSMTFQHPRFRNQVLFVRYEDLVQQPDTQIDRIRAFTGLALEDYNPAEFWAGGGRDFRSDRKSGDPYINELYGKGVSTSRVGRYREKLTPGEIRVIETECAPIFSAFGYKQDQA